ncbi:GrpE nucleotide exchange factor [Corchorus capsularis]|uniref:GrpE nucleotide exchange factor n=1 Tax=Corchorus capsularis TaxID=210143 RepID=A0A1R3IA95_COCAP|nr:GrpE nucleotide exchange factor [Corchorus capsularis]
MEKQLAEVFRKFGVEKFDPTNEPFDPHRHNAVFQVPDNSKPPGTVAHVLKSPRSAVMSSSRQRRSNSNSRQTSKYVEDWDLSYEEYDESSEMESQITRMKAARQRRSTMPKPTQRWAMTESNESSEMEGQTTRKKKSKAEERQRLSAKSKAEEKKSKAEERQRLSAMPKPKPTHVRWAISDKEDDFFDSIYETLDFNNHERSRIEPLKKKADKDLDKFEKNEKRARDDLRNLKEEEKGVKLSTKIAYQLFDAKQKEVAALDEELAKLRDTRRSLLKQLSRQEMIPLNSVSHVLWVSEMLDMYEWRGRNKMVVDFSFGPDVRNAAMDDRRLKPYYKVGEPVTRQMKKKKKVA